eukprot:3764834-Rhodomonas_salina.1
MPAQLPVPVATWHRPPSVPPPSLIQPAQAPGSAESVVERGEAVSSVCVGSCVRCVCAPELCDARCWRQGRCAMRRCAMRRCEVGER